MSIKYLFFILGVVCACHTTPEYIIKGNLENYSGKVFLMTSSLEKKSDTLFTTEVKDGKFEIRGCVREPIAAWLQVDKGDFKVSFFLENMLFSLKADMSTPVVYEFTGGRLQTLREEFKREVEDSVQARRASLREEYRHYMLKDSLFGMLCVRASMDNLDTLYEAKEDLFIRANNNIVSAALVRGRLKELIRKNMLIQKYELLGDTAKNSVIGKELNHYVEQERKTAIGAIAPDFTMNTPEDKPLSLHSVKAKMKILDFWASWCGPCRAENPNVRKLYEKYHDAGLEIVSVSLDVKKEKWVQAIEADQLPWIHVSDLKGWECAAAKLYGIHGVPHVIVLDAENRIIGIGLRGKELEGFLEKVMFE